MQQTLTDRKAYFREWKRKNALALNAKNKAYRIRNAASLKEKQDAYRAKNRAKILERKRAYRDANKDKIRAYTRRTVRGRKDYVLRSRFGITLQQLEKMSAEQGSKCAICRGDGVLAVDHCHSTGKVRGLLCGKCNKGLGLLGDTAEGLKNALRYLEQP